MQTFDHEQLHVYGVAIKFVVFADAIASGAPGGRSYLSDQLRRAATSIVLNIAEGAGEFSRKDKARLYRIARRSATECAAILDVFVQLDCVAPESVESGRALVKEIVAMLTRLVLNLTIRERAGERAGERG
jgi:four helix bundle protein